MIQVIVMKVNIDHGGVCGGGDQYTCADREHDKAK